MIMPQYRESVKPLEYTAILKNYAMTKIAGSKFSA